LALCVPDQEKHADPEHADFLVKYAWGSNSHGQLGMPYINDKKRKTGVCKLIYHHDARSIARAAA
jgi:alpha-tubulin suppressor-like RCC1 family protein